MVDYVDSICEFLNLWEVNILIHSFGCIQPASSWSCDHYHSLLLIAAQYVYNNQSSAGFHLMFFLILYNFFITLFWNITVVPYKLPILWSGFKTGLDMQLYPS